MIRKNILLVDDDKDIQELVTFFLEQAGFIVKTVNDGFSALADIQTDQFDLLILDISMPYMNGFTVLKTLRSMEKFKNFPVIMLTGSDDKKDFDKVRGEVSDYVLKPPKREDLLSRIERILGGRPQYEELKFGVDDPASQGSFTLPARLLSISHRGFVLVSPVPLAKNFMVESMQFTLFQNIGLQKTQFRVIHCAEDKNGTYECFISFLGMDELDKRRLHEWLMVHVFTGKNSPIYP